MIENIENLIKTTDDEMSPEFLSALCSDKLPYPFHQPHLFLALKSPAIKPVFGDVITAKKIINRGIHVFIARCIESGKFYYVIYQKDKLISTIPYFYCP